MTPENEALTAEIELCTKLQAEYEAAFKEIQAAMVERRKDDPRESFKEEYAAEDASAEDRMAAFEEDGRQRQEKLFREANDYFNEEYGHNIVDSQRVGILLDVNVP